MESQSSDVAYSKQKEFIAILKSGKEKHLHKTRSQEIKERISLGHGGKSVMIKEELGSDITDTKKIAQDLGLTSGQVSDARKTLRKWNVELPRIKKSYAAIQKEIEAENDDNKLQDTLDGLSMESITSFMRNNKDQTTFTKLGNLLADLGFARNAGLVGEKLRSNGIPVGEYSREIKGEKHPQVTWVILNKHKGRILGVAEGLSELGQLKRKP